MIMKKEKNVSRTFTQRNYTVLFYDPNTKSEGEETGTSYADSFEECVLGVKKQFEGRVEIFISVTLDSEKPVTLYMPMSKFIANSDVKYKKEEE